MSIKDYGKGFDQNTCPQGNGLENMLNRAKEINAKMEIISAPGEGTAINLQVNV